MLIVNKETGETMGQLIKKYKKDYKKICFCGRLDPLARGKVLLLCDEECKQMPRYNSKDKVYQFEIILGLDTLSTDFMGEPGYHFNIDYDLNIIKQQIINYMNNYNNTEFEQEYHCYSSKRVNGIPLWQWTKKGNIYPKQTHNVTLYNYKYIEDIEYDYKKWRNDNIDIITNIEGDFRQKMICKLWKVKDTDSKNNTINKINSIKFEIKTSSGFYVRQFIKDISLYIKLPLLTYDINRTEILFI
jgi:tRNA pseudouridine55 synthase